RRAGPPPLAPGGILGKTCSLFVARCRMATLGSAASAIDPQFPHTTDWECPAALTTSGAPQWPHLSAPTGTDIERAASRRLPRASSSNGTILPTKKAGGLSV